MLVERGRGSSDGNNLVETQPLFRQEVVFARKSQWLGTVLVVPSVSHTLWTLFAVLAAAAVVALLVGADYTRKARIAGWLVPELGMTRVLAPRPGLVTQVFVREGEAIRRGQPLFALSGEQRSMTRGATQEQILRQLAARRDSLAAERELQHRLLERQTADRQQRLAVMAEERRHLDKEIELQQAWLAMTGETVARLRKLRSSEITTAQRLEEAEADQAQQAVRLQELERNRANGERDRLALAAELEALPIEQKLRLADIDRAVAALDQEMAEAEARREIVVTAPHDGTVAALQASPGATATPGTPLLSLVAEGAALEAELFSPSRAIGFVHPGQRVLLRYQAFPYQQFGLHQGVVKAVSAVALAPADLPQQLAGLTSLHGTDEPVYRVTVALASQTVAARGKAMPLQPGMRLDADLMLETRKLIEWMLDPLYTLGRRLQP